MFTIAKKVFLGLLVRGLVWAIRHALVRFYGQGWMRFWRYFCHNIIIKNMEDGLEDFSGLKKSASQCSAIAESSSRILLENDQLRCWSQCF